MDSPDVHTICVLEPFLSPSKLLVTPVVAFLTNPAMLDELEASANEVARIFDHPLQAFLDPTLAKDEALSEMGSEDWPYETEFQVCMLKAITYCHYSAWEQSTSDVQASLHGFAMYRMHRFRSCASPIKGLTADIMVCRIDTVRSNPRQLMP
jgi:coenzyme A diphosphatase NUDT7